MRTLAIKTGASVLLAFVTAASMALSTDPESPGLRHDLTRVDVDAWLDGYLPYALAQADIAGAVVVIVKDGQVLTQRGYGYADVAARQRIDPATTMFRPGSISKLFTWTAVMQLVEQGKIDLDVDVNRYLDFTIPPYGGKPITMHNIMTHTTGFEESLKHLIIFEGRFPPLGEALKNRLPKRVFAPRTTPAYSNYAVGLAGYIVERVSGMPFEEYIERYIFEPLSMTHATFLQPLPGSLAPFMSKGYIKASQEAEPYELVTLPPAGSAAVSGADMAKFMIAHLNQGAGLMKPATAQLMHDPSNVTMPGTNRMALGFYEQRLNDVSAIAHAGDALNFHSDLWLLPSENVGLFISMNAAGVGNATHDIRRWLFQQFGDRYYPAANHSAPIEMPTAKHHAKMLAGNYIPSRGSFSNFLDVLNFVGQMKVGLDEDGRPLIASLPNLAGAPRRWIEIAPFLWQDANSHERIGARVENGRVMRWDIDEGPPFTVFNRAPWYRDAAWLMPCFLIGLAVVSLTTLSWPVAAIARRRYRVAIGFSGNDLVSYRLVRVFSWLTLAVLGAWMSVLAPLTIVAGKIDGLVWLLELAGTVGSVGLLIVAIWALQRSWSHPRTSLTTAWRALMAVAALMVLWVMLAFHLISFGTRF